MSQDGQQDPVLPSRGEILTSTYDACVRLGEKGVEFTLRMVGRFYFPEFEVESRTLVETHGLEQAVVFTGVKTGNEKWREFVGADIFCLRLSSNRRTRAW